MGKIKSFFSDKGRVGVFIVCLMLIAIALVSSVFKETYADSAADYTCLIKGAGPYNTSKLADSDGAVVTLYAQWITEEEDNDDNSDNGNNNVENGNGDDSSENSKTDDSENIEESPKTGSLPIILVSLIGIGAFVTFVIYRKKVRV